MNSIFEEDVPTSPYISFLNRKHAKYLNKKLESENLSYGLYPLIVKIYREDGISQEDLAEFFQLNESTITRNLKKLEEKGFITKTAQHRKKIITITSKGEKTANKIMDFDDQWEEIIRKDITQEEYNQYKKTLQKIIKSLI
ncbi:MAG: hypothetical protein BZ135_04900 [Methanosphaera sp. rholeuAM6]|nr:MAG: hypothetical protein BZ135_04900 [Methanosphaera sp. rholeuAM6]